jgi:iron complex transport system substrate-binding protein
MSSFPLSRRTFAVSAALLAAGLTSCGPKEPDDAAPDGSGGGDYPRTLDTANGDVIIKAKPKRVVALTAPAADELLTLGITPVGVGLAPDDFTDQYPWLDEKLADVASADLVSSQKVQPEAIANLKPDLIIGAAFQLGDKSTFEQLNQIAPTIVPKSPNSNPDWDQRLAFTAEAVDESAKAEEVIKDLKKQYQDAGDAVGDIGEKTYDLVNFGKGNFGIGNGSLFELFGMKPCPIQKEANGSGKLGKTKSVSQERVDEVDADILVLWPITPDDMTALEKDPRYQKLSCVKKGTVFEATAQSAMAFQQASPASLNWLLPQLEPLLRKLA